MTTKGSNIWLLLLPPPPLLGLSYLIYLINTVILHTPIRRRPKQIFSWILVYNKAYALCQNSDSTLQSCVTLMELFNLPVPLFPHYWNKDTEIFTSSECGKDHISTHKVCRTGPGAQYLCNTDWPPQNTSNRGKYK